MSVTAVIESDRFELNGRALEHSQPVQTMYQLLGPSGRIVAAGPAAPIGHRNNQIHLYDRVGLYLNEHHFTYQIEAITFVLWREEATFTIDNDFDGELKVGGIPVSPGITESLMLKSAIPFISRIRGTWQFESGGVWVGFETKGQRLPSRRRSKSRRLVSLSVCLQHDPWDTRYRPLT